MTKINFDFKKVPHETTKRKLTIEGLANAATVDRAQEIISPKAWNLENYKKNPVVLFDHGHDPAFGFLPIGKAVEVTPTEDGLYTKIIISGSSNDKISAVRDLIEEGILKTFSVGFDPKETEKTGEDGKQTMITKAELIETSIVPIPMNQDSTFSKLEKKKHYWKSGFAKKWYNRFYERAELCKKGAWAATAIHQTMFDLLEVGEISNRDAAIKFVAQEAGATMADVKRVMAGDVTPIPENILKAFHRVLKIDLDLLHNLNKGDVAQMQRVESREREKNMEVKELSEKMLTADAVIHCIKVDAEKYESLEQAAAVVSEAGYSVENSAEEDGYYRFIQTEEADIENSMSIEISSGILAEIAPAIKAEAEEEVEEQVEEQVEEEAEEDTQENNGEPLEIKGVEAVGDDNPYLELSRQNNLLLANLITEIQGMSAKMDGMVDLNLKMAENEEEDEEDEDDDDVELRKSLDQFDKYKTQLSKRLKNLNV